MELIITKVLIILMTVSISECCFTATINETEKIIDTIFPWTVMMYRNLSESYKIPEGKYLHYGSLIHPRAVLTQTMPSLTNYYTGYICYGGCNFSIESSNNDCQNRTVSNIIDVKSDNQGSVDYTVIILKKPFHLYYKLNTINLAKSTDNINYGKCHVYAVENFINNKNELLRVLMMAPYRVRVKNATARLLKSDRHYRDINNRQVEVGFENYIMPQTEFRGSPVVCQRRASRKNYLQIGYLNINVTRINGKVSGTRVSQSFVNLTSVHDNIYKNLNDYFVNEISV